MYTLVSKTVLISFTLALDILYRLLMFSTSIAAHLYIHIYLTVVTAVHHVSLLYLVKVLSYSVLPIFRLYLP